MSIVREDLINVDDALKRVGGNMGLYQKLLVRFAESTHHKELQESLTGCDFEAARQHAHTIKGVAANLSLIQLQLSCAELECVIKNGDNYKDKLEAFKSAYSDTIAAIKQITA